MHSSLHAQGRMQLHAIGQGEAVLFSSEEVQQVEVVSEFIK